MPKITPELNEVQETILKQIKAQEPLFMFIYKVQTVLIVDDSTIRLCCRTRHKINFEVHYDAGLDLYTVKAWLLRDYGLDLHELLNMTEIQWDQLADLLHRAHEDAKTAPPPKPRNTGGGLPPLEEIPAAVRR